jgi:integrase/recombinase XerC
MLLEQFNEKKDEFLIFIDIEKNLSEHTQRAYKNDLEQFITFWNQITEKYKQDIPLKDAIGKFLVFMFHNKIDKSSIARKISCFKSFEKFLNNQSLKLNLNLLRPKLDKKLPIYLTIDEIFNLLDTITDEQLPTSYPLRDKAIFELLYATGVRCSELVNIRLCDVDFENKLIRVMGKGKRERLVLFGQKAKDRLVDYVNNERCKNNTDLEQKFFLNNRDEGLTSRSVQRIIEMFRKFLKIERKITPHKLRHSFATHMLNQGVDLRIVQELLGHKTLSSTEKYTHVTTTELADLCDNLHPFNSMLKSKKEDNAK